jgi:ankyrin repeat protein
MLVIGHSSWFVFLMKMCHGFLIVGFFAATTCLAENIASGLSAQNATLNSSSIIDNLGNADDFVSAAAAGDEAKLQSFIQSGIDINVTNKYGYSALMWAAGQGRSNIVQSLLSRGAVIDKTSSDGSTALFFAAQEGRMNVVPLLLAKGASLKARKADGWTPFICAAAYNQVELLEFFLLEKGVDVEETDKQGDTALMFAAANVFSQDATGETLPAVNLLLDWKANPNATNKKGQTPLMLAAQKGEVEIAKLLTSKKADIHARDKNGKNALHYAVEEGADPPIAIYLIEQGCELDTQDDRGETALMKASAHKNRAMAITLAVKGSNPNLQAKDGKTALMIAVECGNGAIAAQLLQSGANPMLKDRDGLTAYDVARQFHHEDFLPQLKAQ